MITYSTPFGEFGSLYTEAGKLLANTLEQNYNDNKPFESCLPRGAYELIPFASKRFGETYALQNEDKGVTVYKENYSKRYSCLIHAANSQSELSGCIAPGKLGTVYDKTLSQNVWGVTQSRIHQFKVMNYLAESGDRILTIESQIGIR